MEYWQLKQRQKLDLELKIILTNKLIRKWYEYNNGNVSVSFSAGKDSTVLLDLVRRIYPEVPAVFVDTGLEYPEIKTFAKTKNNLVILRPIISFKKVLEKYGYPVISKKVARQIRTLRNPTNNNIATRKLYLEGIKRDGTKTKSFKLAKKWHFLLNAPFKLSEQCCDVMKKEPLKRYKKETGLSAFVGSMANDSLQRESTYLKTGCNNYNAGISNPMSFWVTENVWEYIAKYDLEYSDIYKTGVKRTGCIFCCFGVHLEKGLNRFQMLKKTHPKLWDYCIFDLKIKEVLDYINIKCDGSLR